MQPIVVNVFPSNDLKPEQLVSGLHVLRLNGNKELHPNDQRVVHGNKAAYNFILAEVSLAAYCYKVMLEALQRIQKGKLY